jgi:hypothetical protein
MRTCQACESKDLEFVLSLGWLPPPNDFRPIGIEADHQIWMPTDLFYCNDCSLVQLAYSGPSKVVFPSHYPYTRGVTGNLRANFVHLYNEMKTLLGLESKDFIIDIGSNDGTLLSNFVGKHKVLGIEPTDIADLANKQGITTHKAFFNAKEADYVKSNSSKASRIIVTCANCFAHMPDVPDIMKGIKTLIGDNGVFVSESHYLMDLLTDLQYDTIYHEHLRYYSVKSIRNLLMQFGLEVFHVRTISTHGGGIRVYAAPPGLYPVQSSVEVIMAEEPDPLDEFLKDFAEDVYLSKLELMSKMTKCRLIGCKVVGIGAPSRAATVINYCRLELEYIAELKDSLKVGKYMPGTNTPVVDEEILFGDNQPPVAILFSWHIADEIVPKLREKGFHGKIILPCERIV